MKTILPLSLGLLIAGMGCAEEGMPKILTDKGVQEKHFLPDFSYAGYHFGEKEIPASFDHTLTVTDFGAKPDDGFDDSQAFMDAIAKADELEGYVEIKIPTGTFHISKIIYINRSKTVLKGIGTGVEGTVLHFPQPLRFVDDPPEHAELKEYMRFFNKRQVEPKFGVNAPFSQYSWSGGYLWVAKKGKNYKSYNVPSFDHTINSYANALAGQQGAHEITVDDSSKIAEGQAYKLCWFNKDGEEGSFLKHLYDDQDVEIGCYHWDTPDSPLISQMVLVTKIEGDKVFIKDPLLHDVKTEWFCSIAEWEHIEEVGIENIAFEFPMSPDRPHHLEDGNNALYLTSLMNGWVRNVRFLNADSGILTDDISNVTIENVRTHGEKIAHYSVSMGEVHNVLVENLKVENVVRHPLSFNTRSSKCVYTCCEMEKNPILDQHSGANQQNLFDNIKVSVDAAVHKSYKFALFKGGGQREWWPAHGAFSTIFNIEIHFANVPEKGDKPIVLNGSSNGVSARLIGLYGNHPVKIDYKPNAYLELINEKPALSSLYEYQLKQRKN